MQKPDYIPAEIIDESTDEEDNSIQKVKKSVKTNVKKPKSNTSLLKHSTCLLKKFYNEDENIIEIGVDEAGRGPLFGRVYTAAVILPKDDTFNHSLVKDSKKFHSKKKIEEVADYIKENALAWAVEYEDEQIIDEINILQATQSAMHKGIKNVLSQLSKDNYHNYHNLQNCDNILLLVDGNYFNPFTILNKDKTKLEIIKYEMIEGGDNKYTSIAAASILAKVERDRYIEQLCEENQELVEHYGIDSNKGYGSKTHMDGIKKHGITKWHRKTFGICKNYC